MKIFYYKKEKQTRRTYGGMNVTASIYTAKKGEIAKVGVCHWCTSAYMGEESEVFQALMELGYIPKKYEKSSVCEWRGAGYFAGEVCNHYNIKELN